jgi:predicted permease
VLALLGGVLGIALATWGVAAVRTNSVQFLPRQGEIGMNGTVVAFTLTLSVLTGLLFGLAPAVRLSRGPLHATLRASSRGSTGGALVRVRSALVLGEVAIALVLLVGAGLLIRSFEELNRVDLGFEPAGVLTYSLTFPAAKFRDPTQLPSMYDELLTRARALPGVTAAAIGEDLPMSSPAYISFTIGGRPSATDPNAAPEDVQPFSVTSDYFSVLRIPLRRGRLLQPSDGPGATKVALVNEEMVRRYYEGRDPIGSRITFGDPADTTSTWWTVVGVVGNVVQEGVTAKPYAQFYRPITQAPSRGVSVALRTSGDPERLGPAARQAARAVDSDLLVNDIRPLAARVEESIARPRLSVILLTGFSALALLLAAIGIYGVMAYTVAQRTREIGVRMALGADASNVKRLVVRQGMQPALIGVCLGLVGAFGGSRLIASLLYGVSAADPVTFALVPLFLAAVAFAATYLPARRATRVPPTVALQSE